MIGAPLSPLFCAPVRTEKLSESTQVLSYDCDQDGRIDTYELIAPNERIRANVDALGRLVSAAFVAKDGLVRLEHTYAWHGESSGLATLREDRNGDGREDLVWTATVAAKTADWAWYGLPIAKLPTFTDILAYDSDNDFDGRYDGPRDVRFKLSGQ